MTKKEEKYINIWKKNIEKGKSKFVIKTTITWAFFVTLFTPFFKWLIDFDLTQNKLLEAYEIKYLLIQFIFFILAGILFSLVMWKSGLKKYNQLTKTNE